jgi:1,4-alpha-glucan branching enzyme
VRDNNGMWRIQLMLTPGRYRYQFVIDGEWLNDPKSCGCRLDHLRGNNCAVRIS